MQKKTLHWIVFAVAIALALFQYLNEDVSTDLATPEPASVTQTSVLSSTDTPAPVVNVSETETPATVESPTVTVAPPLTAVPTETSWLDKPTGDFDFFVLALSWSPDYCASNGGDDPQQCSIGKKLDFVLHGLWPQYDNGYPIFCSTETLPDDLKDEFSGLYPSEALFDHEWEKHGTCTGLTPEGYLLWSQELKESVMIPAAFNSPEEPFRTDAEGLKASFMQVNAEFNEDSFAVYCSGSGRFLKELFVCFAKDGSPTDCGSDLHNKASKSCGQADFLVRNTR